MKIEWRRYAQFGLYLALLAALFAIGYYIVYRKFDLILQISLGLILVGLAIFALLDPERVRQALTGRQARYGSNALVLVIAFFGIVVVLNYLVYNNTKRWDLTENKQYTLAQETLDTLGKLDQPVQAKAFYTKSVSSDQARDLLEQYKFNSAGKFDYEFIDPDANPAAAEQAKISRDGTIVLVMSGRQEPVSIVSEQEMTGALLRLMNPEKRAVYFLSGHGEGSINQSGNQSYTELKRTLESKNYTVNSLNLLTENKIPEDAWVIVIAGPQKPLAQSEIDLLSAYQATGKGLVVMTNPLPLTEFGDQADPLNEYLEKNWSLSMGADIVVDLTSQQAFAPYAASYGSSPITEKLQNITSQFPTVRSVQAITETVSGVSPVELVLTAQQSWAETDMENLSGGDTQINFDQGEDLPGPVSLAVAAENFQNNSRVVAFGDPDFALDANFYAYANGDLIVNSIDWAAGREELINLTPKDTTQRMLLPPQSAMMNLILLGTVVILPALALVGGIWIWFRRRRRA